MRFATPESWLGERPLRVIVAGAGGTGSAFLDALGRLDRALRAQGHAGMLATVYDPDTVSESNIGRQRFTPHDIGFNKAVLMVHRINNFYGLDWTAKPAALDPALLQSFDLLVGCVDRGRFRYQAGYANAGARREALFLDTGNGADCGQVVLGHLGVPQQGLRLPNVYDLYGKELLAGDADGQPSCSLTEALLHQRWSINPLVATVAASLLDNLLFRGGIEEHGALIRLNPLNVVGLPIDARAWAGFGYAAPARPATQAA